MFLNEETISDLNFRMELSTDIEFLSGNLSAVTRGVTIVPKMMTGAENFELDALHKQDLYRRQRTFSIYQQENR